MGDDIYIDSKHLLNKQYLTNKLFFFCSLSISMRGGKAWFAIEAKSFEIKIEEKGKKLRGCIWERSKGVSPWIKFGDLSFRHLLLGIEDCKKISCDQVWFTRWEEEGRIYKLERCLNNAGSFIRC